ncbi:UNVERIFIED_CONTAM: hypothetical protein PYX00_011557 [Menopon gallinae]|uniref:Small ribosomal subunit protein eS17 n=1 Tax=Menopon gallinae TaxID=328185 RepID=A0AAW2H7P1_9NEOP
MGRVRNSIVKRAGEKIVAKYYMKLDKDFHHNKLVVKDVAEIPSKRLRNQVAGFVTRLYSRVQKGTVKKIFIKKHEEERERKENLIPSSSIMDAEKIEVDDVTIQMIKDYCYRGNYVATGSNE